MKKSALKAISKEKHSPRRHEEKHSPRRHEEHEEKHSPRRHEGHEEKHSPRRHEVHEEKPKKNLRVLRVFVVKCLKLMSMWHDVLYPTCTVW